MVENRCNAGLSWYYRQAQTLGLGIRVSRCVPQNWFSQSDQFYPILSKIVSIICYSGISLLSGLIYLNWFLFFDVYAFAGDWLANLATKQYCHEIMPNRYWFCFIFVFSILHSHDTCTLFVGGACLAGTYDSEYYWYHSTSVVHSISIPGSQLYIWSMICWLIKSWQFNGITNGRLWHYITSDVFWREHETGEFTFHSVGFRGLHHFSSMFLFHMMAAVIEKTRTGYTVCAKLHSGISHYTTTLLPHTNNEVCILDYNIWILLCGATFLWRVYHIL